MHTITRLPAYGLFALAHHAVGVEALHAAIALFISAGALTAWKTTAAIAPHDFECVGIGAPLRVLDPHHRAATSTRILHQRLPPAAGDSAETDVHRIRRHRACTLESAELRLASGNIAQIRHIAANVHFGAAIHHHFDGAPATHVVATAYDPRTLLNLRERGRSSHTQDRHAEQ
jgi:hypothetical protein